MLIFCYSSQNWCQTGNCLRYRACPPTKELFLIIHMHMMKRELIPGRKKRVRRMNKHSGLHHGWRTPQTSVSHAPRVLIVTVAARRAHVIRWRLNNDEVNWRCRWRRVTASTSRLYSDRRRVRLIRWPHGHNQQTRLQETVDEDDRSPVAVGRCALPVDLTCTDGQPLLSSTSTYRHHLRALTTGEVLLVHHQNGWTQLNRPTDN